MYHSFAAKLVEKKNDANPSKLSSSPSKAMNNNMNMSNSVGGSPLNASPSEKSSLFKKVALKSIYILYCHSISYCMQLTYHLIFNFQGLVDYEGDSDDEDEEEGNGDLMTPVHKRARLS